MISGNKIRCEDECDSLKQFVERKEVIADFEQLSCNTTKLETFYKENCETKGNFINYVHAYNKSFSNCLL